jgi:hypothetical protein
MSNGSIWYAVGPFVVIGLLAVLVLWAPAPAPGSQASDHGGNPTSEVVNGTTFGVQSEYLFGNASWLHYSFRGVTFVFHLWCSIEADTGIVCGNATEPNGVSYPYSFSDGLPSSNPPWQTWIAPDGHEGAQYQQGGSARLLVAV